MILVEVEKSERVATDVEVTCKVTVDTTYTTTVSNVVVLIPSYLVYDLLDEARVEYQTRSE